MFAPLILAGGLVLSQPVVVDGDTIRDGHVETYRIENLDAPEIGRADCPAERAMGEAARALVQRWVAAADTVEAFPVGRRDRYGRVIVRVEIDGEDMGQMLIARGLAVHWTGRKHNFCADLNVATR
jgi:micrococcal nuclease